MHKRSLMDKKVLLIFTGKSLKQCLQAGGTQSWALNRANARHCKYAVLCQNAYADGSWAEGNEPHGSAFMVGRISDVVPSREEGNEGRWLVLFDEYAQINIPNIWQGWRNPVRYTTFEELSLKLDDMHFEPMPSAPEENRTIESPSREKIISLTIQEAKEGLAAKYGVKPEAIEVIIRG